MNAYATTFADLTRTLVAMKPAPRLLPKTEPTLLRDVLFMKRSRGDADADQFKTVAREFASWLDATIGGAAWAMRQWIERQEAGGAYVPGTRSLAARKAFLADLDAVIAGDRAGWVPPHERAA